MVSLAMETNWNDKHRKKLLHFVENPFWGNKDLPDTIHHANQKIDLVAILKQGLRRDLESGGAKIWDWNIP